MRDPYQVLGVNRKASIDDVKSAFRGLAKQYHPDIAGDNDMIAATFQEINTAYDILGDISKRDQFDRGEIDAKGIPVMRRQNARPARERTAGARTTRQKNNASGRHKSAADAWAARARAGGSRQKPEKNFGEDFKTYSWGKQGSQSHDGSDDKASDKGRRSRTDEVFNDLFSGLRAKAQSAQARSAKQKSSRAKQEAEKPETANPSKDDAPKTSAEQDVRPRSSARPRTEDAPQPHPTPSGPTEDSHYNLTIEFEEAARGTSRRVKLPNGKRLDVKIPAGVVSGQQIRLKGQGKADEADAGTSDVGDAILEIQVEAHRYFKCEGDDIYLSLPVTVDEAVLGARVMVPTLDGPVAMSVPPGANCDTTLRLKGRGLPRKDSDEEKVYGDQYVTLKIVLPSASDTDFNTLVETWAAKNTYDVRSDFEF